MSDRDLSELLLAVAYYRMSSSQQEASIPEQRQWAARAARAHGVQLLAEFEDAAIPGSETDRRPGLMRMLDYCRAAAAAGRAVRAVVCWDGERFSRADSIATAVVLDGLRRAGTTRLLTNSDGWIDLEDDVDRLLFNIKQDMTRAAYSKAISRNATRSALQRALAGEWVAGRPPYGYVIGPDRHLAPGDPARVETVAWMFRQYATSADSQGDLARALRQGGAPGPEPRRRKDGSPWGGRWTRFLVADVLHNRHYLGEIVWNATHTGKYSRVKAGEVSRAAGGRHAREVNGAEDRIVVAGAHPPLIDPDTFRACQEKLARSGPGPRCRCTPAAGGGEWVLSGLLHCGHCGGRMGGITERQRRGARVYTYRHYVCKANVRHGPGSCRKNAVRQDEVLADVAALIREHVTDPGKRAAVRAEAEALAAEQARDDGAARGRMRQELARLDDQIARGNRNLAVLPEDRLPGVVAAVRAWEAEREALARELARADAAAEAGRQFVARVTAGLEELSTLEEKIAGAEPAVVRDMLAGLVAEVRLYFRHGPPNKSGNRKAHLDSLEVDLTAEAAELFGVELWRSGSRSPQVTLRGGARRAC